MRPGCVAPRVQVLAAVRRVLEVAHPLAGPLIPGLKLDIDDVETIFKVFFLDIDTAVAEGVVGRDHLSVDFHPFDLLASVVEEEVRGGLALLEAELGLAVEGVASSREGEDDPVVDVADASGPAYGFGLAKSARLRCAPIEEAPAAGSLRPLGCHFAFGLLVRVVDILVQL